MAEAGKVVDRAMLPLEQPLPPPFDSSTARGRTFWIIPSTMAAPSVAAVANGFVEAAKSVGATGVVFDGKGSPVLFDQGLRSAIGAQAAGVVLLGFDPLLVKAGLGDAQRAGVPVIAAVTGDPDPQSPVDGIFAYTTYDSRSVGKIQAAYAARLTGCRAKAVMFLTEASSANVFVAEGAEGEFARLCPQTCALERVNVPATEFSTKLAGMTQSALQRDPAINVVLTPADSFVTYIDNGQRTLGSRVPVIGAVGNGLQAAQSGNTQVADVLFPPLALQGYLFFDAAMRAAAGQKARVVLSSRLVDATNWGADPSDATQFPGLVDFRAELARLWSRGRRRSVGRRRQ